MPEILTAKEIQEYVARGLKSIVVEQMPILTDEARDAMKRLDFEIRVQPSGGAAKIKEPAAPSPAVSKCRESFKQRLQKGKPLLGTFIQIAHPVMTEFVGKLGFDFLLIDSEHSAMHIETIQSMLQGIAATPSYGVVRIPTISYEYIASYSRCWSGCHCRSAGAKCRGCPQGERCCPLSSRGEERDWSWQGDEFWPEHHGKKGRSQ